MSLSVEGVVVQSVPVLPGAAARRCRAASKSTTAPATAALSDSTPTARGTVSRASAASTHAGGSPWASEPTTTATGPDGQVVGPGDAYAQARQALSNIQEALGRLGAGMQHVVRTRMFVTDIGRWQEFGRAHGEFFAEIRPAASMLEVKALIDPAMLIEIEADAVIP